ELFGTEQVDPSKVARAIDQVFDLRRPIYRRTATYGHFGRPDKELTWEVTSRLAEFKQAVGL
ncbi:MAG TPA: methionine adenosyltransferase domain-containing protein, partial [Acidimicrobiales bacterium]|nr:methionine adenosyltransferase domain-containing protein [Acidimicrobiales bacterium]